MYRKPAHSFLPAVGNFPDKQSLLSFINQRDRASRNGCIVHKCKITGAFPIPAYHKTTHESFLSLTRRGRVVDHRPLRRCKRTDITRKSRRLATALERAGLLG